MVAHTDTSGNGLTLNQLLTPALTNWSISKLTLRIASFVLAVVMWLWLASVRPAGVRDPGYRLLRCTLIHADQTAL